MIKTLIFSPVIVAGMLWELTCMYFKAGQQYVRDIHE